VPGIRVFVPRVTSTTKKKCRVVKVYEHKPPRTKTTPDKNHPGQKPPRTKTIPDKNHPMVIFNVIAQTNIASFYSYLHVCVILHQTHIHSTHVLILQSKMIYRFQMSLLIHFHRMQCPSPIRVSSMDLSPSVILVQRL